MPRIHIPPVEAATGPLKRLFDYSIKRSGRVWNISSIMSPNPSALRDSMRLYKTVMMSESPLSRVEREILATVVSAEVGCHY